MTTFEILSKEPEFVKLDAKRGASLDALIVHNESLNALDREKPSLTVHLHVRKICSVLPTWQAVLVTDQ